MLPERRAPLAHQEQARQRVKKNSAGPRETVGKGDSERAHW